MLMILFVGLMTTWQQYVLVEYMLCMLSFGSIFLFCFFLWISNSLLSCHLLLYMLTARTHTRRRGTWVSRQLEYTTYCLTGAPSFPQVYHSPPPLDRKTLKLTLPLSAMLDLSSISPILNGPWAKNYFFYPFLVSFEQKNIILWLLIRLYSPKCNFLSTS